MMLDKQVFDFPKGISLRTEQVEAIKQVLCQLVERCPAQRALVAEASGQVIASGGTQFFANPEGLAALAAGYIAAGQAITYLTEPKPIEQSILREGEDTYTFLYEAGQHLILFVQVSKEVPLGWARLNVQKASQQLVEALDVSVEVPGSDTPAWTPADLLSEKIDDAFSALWEGSA